MTRTPSPYGLVSRLPELLHLGPDTDADVLAPLDQAAAAATLATGRNSLIQITWIYDGGVDRDRVEAFRTALGNGLLGRRAAPSPLPFGPFRWVRAAPPPLAVAPTQCRADIDDWFEERRLTPVDPFGGPGWHLALAPLDDGGVALTLVASHVLADGVGVAVAAAEAALGMTRELRYPLAPAGLVHGALEDSRATARSLPAAARGIREVVAMARGKDSGAASAPGGRPARDASDVTGPEFSVMPYLDRAATVARAAELGGKESQLMFVLAARIAKGLGWVRPSDGKAILGMSVARRGADDLRANAIVDVELELDPDTEDLPAVRAAVKLALEGVPAAEKRFATLSPLAPLLPRRAVVGLVESPPDLSHPITTTAGVGVLPAPVRSPVGTPADRTSFRLRYADLPGHTPVARAAFLYVGWTGTEEETAVGITTNLAAATQLGLATVVEQACRSLGIEPSAISVPAGDGPDRV
ncbi:hypothetical protein GCM10023147_34990 [Tsukamurella soli]|uniref:Condensation domain-containing protein n=1 Tax=Tsukamurella soli TaxID=644556 RepID=A0ABP8K052_9ACTN